MNPSCRVTYIWSAQQVDLPKCFSQDRLDVGRPCSSALPCAGRALSGRPFFRASGESTDLLVEGASRPACEAPRARGRRPGLLVHQSSVPDSNMLELS